MVTARIEDYLEEIFLLESTGRNVSVTDIAKRLGVTKGTVTAAARKMVEAGVLNHERYGSLHLTEKGRLKGLSLYQRHEGLRAFFHELLGADREYSSKMACGMEHCMDSVTGGRLYSMLEFFRRAKAAKEPWIEDFFRSIDIQVPLPLPLSVLPDGQSGVIARLSAGEDMRKCLQNKGFKAGVSVTCLDASAAEALKVTLEGKELTIPRSEAAAVWLQTA
jgi:DtxR family Mn-dependent transcriptional regulator